MLERAERDGFQNPKYEDQLTTMMKENEGSKKCSGIHKHERDNVGPPADRKRTQQAESCFTV